MADPGDKDKFYRWVKLAGLLYFVPLMLAAGPLTGYLFGVFFMKQFKLHPMVPLLGFGLGMLVAVGEILRIVRMIRKIEEKNRHGS